MVIMKTEDFSIEGFACTCYEWLDKDTLLISYEERQEIEDEGETIVYSIPWVEYWEDEDSFHFGENIFNSDWDCVDTYDTTMTPEQQQEIIAKIRKYLSENN